MIILCIDLEETIIDNIWDGNILHANISKIKKIIKQAKPDRIITFSFALIDEKDARIWAAVQEDLKEAGINIETQTFEVRKLQAEFLRKKFGIHKLPKENSNEFLMEWSNLCTKELVFEWWAMQQAEESVSILIDDMVVNKTVICGKKAIKFIKI